MHAVLATSTKVSIYTILQLCGSVLSMKLAKKRNVCVCVYVHACVHSCVCLCVWLLVCECMCRRVHARVRVHVCAGRTST